jgi:uncharacterized protein (DUF3084 family)
MPNQTTDFIPYLFLAAMIVIGGLVAWVADSLGRKIGKKRLSFLGLRPRHTATLITIGAGVIIPVLTIGAIYALSSDVRQWIQKGRTAIQEVIKKTEEVDSLGKRVDSLGKQVSSLDTQKGNLESKVGRLTSRTSELQGKVDKQQAALTQSTGQLKVSKTQVAKLTSSVRAKEAALRDTNSELKQTSTRLENLRMRQQELNSTLRNLSGSYKEVDDQRREAYAQLDTVNRQIEAEEQKSEQLRQQRDALNNQIEQSKIRIADYEAETQRLQMSINNSAKALEELNEQLSTARQTFGQGIGVLRSGKLIFEAGEEVARIQVPRSLSPEGARTYYINLLESARDVALKRKARNEKGMEPAGLVTLKVTDGGSERLLSVDEQETAITRGLTAQPIELLLTTRAKYNTFEGEFVLLEFGVYRNRLVYSSGQLVAEKRIDGRKSDYEVLEQIREFLTENVRAKALKDGMIPPPNRLAQVGEVREDRVFEAIREARSHNQLVRIQAIAEDETKSGDQLQLQLRIRL